MRLSDQFCPRCGDAFLSDEPESYCPYCAPLYRVSIPVETYIAVGVFTVFISALTYAVLSLL